MQTIVIDDKPATQKVLKKLLAKHFPKIQIVGEAHNVSEGIQVISQNKPQLVFLDIEMPDGSGFDLLEKLDTIDFKVIFITGFEQYAFKALKFGAIDYLLKPIDPEDLKIAVQKAEEKINREILQFKATTLLNTQQAEVSKKIILQDANTIHTVQVHDILYLEASADCTQLYLSNKRQILLANPLQKYEILLEKMGFFRCHKSYIINLRAIRKFERKGKGTVILENNIKIPIASNKKEALIALLDLLPFL